MLNSHEIISEEFQPSLCDHDASRHRQIDGRTDRQTAAAIINALCIALRGNGRNSHKRTSWKLVGN